MTVQEQARDVPAQEYASPTARGLLRRARGPLIVVAVILVITVAVMMLSAGPDRLRPYDPDDFGLSGGHALAELLRDQGVTVNRRTGLDEISGDGLALITPMTYLTEEQIREIPGDLLIVGGAVSEAPGVKLGDPRSTATTAPGCGMPEARVAGNAYIGGATFRGARCYEESLHRYTDNGRTITLAGSAEFMTNQRLDEEGNAALALNLAGAQGTVEWTVPPEGGPPLNGRKTLTDLIPEGVWWAVLQLTIATIVTAIWRARRLGPIVAERLPVVVRASETTEGRARLYRARRARDRAASALRLAFLQRVLPRLGLTPQATREEIGTALGDAAEAVYGTAPATDEELTALARRLDTVERELLDRIS